MPRVEVPAPRTEQALQVIVGPVVHSVPGGAVDAQRPRGGPAADGEQAEGRTGQSQCDPQRQRPGWESTRSPRQADEGTGDCRCLRQPNARGGTRTRTGLPPRDSKYAPGHVQDNTKQHKTAQPRASWRSRRAELCRLVLSRAVLSHHNSITVGAARTRASAPLTTPHPSPSCRSRTRRS